MLSNVTAFSMAFAKREEWTHHIRAYAYIPDEQVLEWLNTIDNAAPQQIYAANSIFAEAAMERILAMVARGDSTEWINGYLQGLPEGVYIRRADGKVFELPYPEAEPRLPIELQSIVDKFLDSVRPIVENIIDTKTEDRKRSREDLKQKRREMWRQNKAR